MMKEMSDNSRIMLEKWRLKCETAGISAETKWAVGSPSEVILNQARKQNVDINSNGFNRFKRTLKN